MTAATRRKRDRMARLQEKQQLDGFLPGLVPNLKHQERLLDLYELAHFQAVHGMTLDAEVYARIHPLARPGSNGRSMANYSNPLMRLFAFAHVSGIRIQMLEPGQDRRIRFAFEDPVQALKRTSELLDTLPHRDEDEDPSEDEIRRAA